MANVLCTEWQDMSLIDATQHTNGERNCTRPRPVPNENGRPRPNLDIDLGLDIVGVAVQGPEIEIPCSFEMLESYRKIEVENQMPAEPLFVNIKQEVNLVGLGTTADESMAVEALRQLRGLFNTSEDKSSCDTCKKQFHSRSEFQKHLPLCQQSGHQLHICNVCRETFVRKSDLGNHISSHQADKPHSCSVCGNVYRRKADLQNHMVSHQTTRPHQCQECGADFQRPSSLTNHMKIHSYQPGRALLGLDENEHKAISKPSAVLMHTQPLEAGTAILTNGSDVQSVINLEPNTFYGIDETFYDCNNLPVVPADILNSICISSDSSNICDVYLREHCSQQSKTDKTTAGIFEYFEVPAVSAQVDIVTTDVNHGAIQYDVLSHLQSFKSGHLSDLNNVGKDTSVKVETLPYYAMDESEMQLKEVEEVLNVEPGQIEVEGDLTASASDQHLCNYCGVVLINLEALCAHSQLHHSECSDVFQCSDCGEVFKTEEHFNQHKQHCSVVAQVDTPHCEVGAVGLPVNIPVIPTQRSREKHCCTSCDKRFSTKQKLYRHMWIHRKKQFVCEICGESLDGQEALEGHRQAQHPGETPYVCQSCGRGFASRQGLWEHNRVHGKNSVSQFWCAHCSKTFSSRQGYLIHTRTHTGERPYGCRFCLKAFRDGGTLRKHERIHTGERPHVCPVCYRAFNQKVVLREHVRWVHAANRDVLESDADHLFICEVCNHVLGDREELCAHIVKHSDDLARAAKVNLQNDAVVKSRPKKVVAQRRPKKSKPSKKIKLSEELPNPVEPSSTIPVLTSTVPSLSTQNKDTSLAGRRAVKCLQSSTSSKKTKEHLCHICNEAFTKRRQLLKHVHIHI